MPVGANPYVGPRPFEIGERLYGREREAQDLYYLLSAERVVLLHSPSGAGKSSLVQAGLIPLLRHRFDIWRPTRVGLEPEVSAAAAGAVNRYVLSALQGFEEGIPAELRRPPEALAGQSLATYVTTRPRRPGAPESPLLIFDQFEEILTVDPLAAEAKRAFFTQLGELLHDPRVWALFVLREDFLAPLDPYAFAVPTHLKARFRIDLLGLDAAAEAIRQPALGAGRETTPAALEALVGDLAVMMVQQPDGGFREEAGAHVEPVQLQVVCRRLWDELPAAATTIDREHLARFGDVSRALAAYYADAVAAAAGGDTGRERAIRDWFDRRLITPSSIRGQVVRGAGASGGLGNELVARLLDTHLVRAEKRAGATWYELSHDRLIHPVRDDNATWRHTHLTEAQRLAEAWVEGGRAERLLLDDDGLREAEAWSAGNEDRLTAVERDFLDASRATLAAARREARQRRWIRRLATASAVVSLIALVAVAAAWRLSEVARRDLKRHLAGQQTVSEMSDQRRREAEVRLLSEIARMKEALEARRAVILGREKIALAAAQIFLGRGDPVRAALLLAHVDHPQALPGAIATVEQTFAALGRKTPPAPAGSPRGPVLQKALRAAAGACLEPRLRQEVLGESPGRAAAAAAACEGRLAGPG